MNSQFDALSEKSYLVQDNFRIGTAQSWKLDKVKMIMVNIWSRYIVLVFK